jgi:hypothetical protein
MTPHERDVLDVHWHTFSAVQDRHGRWAGDSWISVAEAPSPEALRGALIGKGSAISGLFLDGSSRTHLGGVDVDYEDGWTTVLGIGRALADAGVSAWIEHSRRGGHVWVVLNWPVPAVVVRRCLMAAVQKAGYDPHDPKIEIRPDTDRKTSPYAGRMLRLPYVPHPLTGERHPLLDPTTEQPIAQEASEFHLVAKLADAERVSDLAELYIPAAITPTYLAPRAGNDYDDSVSAVLIELFGVLNAEPGRSVRCPLHDDHRPSMNIARDDRRAWCHAPACIAYEDGRGITAWQLRHLAGVAA